MDHGNSARPWRTIQFDPENSNTRYFGEMLRQIERSLALTPHVPTPISLGKGSKVAAEINATAITITDSFNFGNGEYDQAVAHEQRAARIVEAIRKRLGDESFCFIFVNSEEFRRQDLAKFTEHVWAEGLGGLTSQGVLLVDLTRSGPRQDVLWPPSQATNLKLSDNYDDSAREHAIDDLSNFLQVSRLEKTTSEARAYARAMLDSHQGPSTLYAQLAAVCATRPHGG